MIYPTVWCALLLSMTLGTTVCLCTFLLDKEYTAQWFICLKNYSGGFKKMAKEKACPKGLTVAAYRR